MGCDIHLHVEVLREGYDNDGRQGTFWHWVAGEHDQDDEADDHAYDSRARDYWEGRYYLLFQVLAGVRDHVDAIEPIAPPRGVPKDATITSRADLGVHSESWLTLAELQAYDWSQTFDDADEGQPPKFVRVSDRVGDFCSRVIPQLALWGKPDEVRIVFGFDS